MSRTRIHSIYFAFLLVSFMFTALTPSRSLACACGCGLFDVGTSAMFPNSAGGMIFMEYDFLDQNQNRSGVDRASADANADKEIRTRFTKAGAQYMFNRNWGTRFEIPYWARTFKTTDDLGNPVTTDHASIGDVRVSGIYTGSSEDMSTGLTFGLQLPTGDSKFTGFDPDTEIGNGSTALLLGAYHLFKISSDGIWNGFAQINLDQPVLSKKAYLPGNEINSAIGGYYAGWDLGKDFRISPVFAALFSIRGSDVGDLAMPGDSGYRRFLIAPALETTIGHFRVNGGVQVPVYQYVNGNQLVAPVAYKLTAMYMF